MQPGGTQGPVHGLAMTFLQNKKPSRAAGCRANLTSSSIFASAMSCSLPLPLAIFCASDIWELTASTLNSSRGYPSTAFMLRVESGWTTANPPDTCNHIPVSFSSLLKSFGKVGRNFLRAMLPIDGRLSFGYNVQKNCLLPPLSSMISTKPGFSCSIEGTCCARIPISPDSAGILTWTLKQSGQLITPSNQFGHKGVLPVSGHTHQ